MERARSGNQRALQTVARRLALMHGTTPVGGGATSLAAGVMPPMRQLASSSSAAAGRHYGWLYSVLPPRWLYFWQGKVREQDSPEAAAAAAAAAERGEAGAAGGVVTMGAHALDGPVGEGVQGGGDEADPIDDD